MDQVRAHPAKQDRAATPSEPSPEEVSGKAGIPCALKSAKALIERGWSQGYVGRSASGTPIDYEDYLTGRKRPASYCAVGAIIKVCGGVDEHWPVADFLEAALGDVSLSEFNDKRGRTQAEVLAAFDKAIALAEQVSA